MECIFDQNILVLRICVDAGHFITNGYYAVVQENLQQSLKHLKLQQMKAKEQFCL